MRILHYSLGFPPYRSGGLTKFCMDLMKEQVKQGNDVLLLWPGRMGLNYPGKTKIIHNSRVEGIASFEVMNPTPVSYDEGIIDIDLFTNYGDKKTYDLFLDEIKPDIIHIHTFMGLHKSLLISASERRIRLIFTVHDFFSICPKVTLFTDGSNCIDALNCNSCSKCNRTALSIRKIKILQSPQYRLLKDSKGIKKIRKSHRDRYLSNSNSMKKENKNNEKEYLDLRVHYLSMLQLMEVIHFNSTITKNIYEKFFGNKLPKTVVISLTHVAIVDHRSIRKYDNKMRITYLGPQSEAKGFFILKKALDRLWKENHKFSLNVYFEPIETASYINVNGRYTSSQLADIFDQTDILVAPSVCYETFGYTVLEALSYGVPVIISSNVGAKDILPDDAGIVIEDINEDNLFNVISSINSMDLQRMNKNVVKSGEIMHISVMNQMIFEKCYRK